MCLWGHGTRTNDHIVVVEGLRQRSQVVDRISQIPIHKHQSLLLGAMKPLSYRHPFAAIFRQDFYLCIFKWLQLPPEGVPCAILGAVIHNDHPQLGIFTDRLLHAFGNILHEMPFVMNWKDEPLIQCRRHEAMATILEPISQELGN